MDVTYVVPKLDMDGGGSNFSLELMGRTLSKRGHDVTILTLNPEKNDFPNNLPFKVDTSHAKFGTRIGSLVHAYQAMSEYAADTDVFHVFSPTLLPAAGYFRKQNDTTPVVGRLNTYTMFCVNLNRMNGDCHRNCTVRSKFAHQDASFRKRLAKVPFYASRTFIEPKLSGNLDAYDAVSPAVKEIYSEVGLPNERISVVPNFYDPTFGPDQIPADGIDSDEPLQLLYVGRIEPMKGLDCLINALPQTSEVEVTIIGTGSALSDLNDLADSEGVEDRVSFEGWISHDELPPYYRDADLFVHPARLPEPFGRTLLESMQMGTPAIVSNVGGPPWVVGNAGQTFPRNNAERLSEIITQFQQRPNRLTKFQEACFKQLKRFEPDTIISQTEKKYRQVMR